MYDSEEDERSEPEDGLDEYGDPVWVRTVCFSSIPSGYCV